MLRILLLAALLTAAGPAGLRIVDESGNPVPHATVQRISAHQFRISAPGFQTRIVIADPRVSTIVLERSPSVIATVRVATGSPQTLHSLPVAASALDRTAIATSAAVTADGLLAELPGFDRTRSNSMFSNYGLLRVSFAGAGNDRGLVLADGIPAQDGFGGQVDWAAYPPQTLQRAELLMGAGSALYGAGAAGGVLSLETFAPPAIAGTAPSAALSFAAGSHAYSRQSFNAAGWISPRVGASLSLLQQRMQYADLPPAYASSIDREAQSNQNMASLRLRYRMSDRDAVEFGQRGAWDDQFEGRPNYTFSRRLSQSDLHYTHDTLQSRIQAIAFARTAYIVNAADLFPAHPGALRYVQDVPTNESGISASWIASGGPSTFEVRADARHVRGESLQYGNGGAFQSGGSGSQNLYGFAVQQSWRAARTQVVAGARMDTLRSYGETLSPSGSPPARSDAAVSPRLAARYDLTPRFSVRASASAGFRPPFLNELVRGYFIGSVAYQPNPALVPERSRTYSAGVDYATGATRIAFDAFDTGVHDAIMFRTIDPTHQMRSNVARTATNGYTLAFSHASGRCSRISASLTSQYARVTAGPAAIIGKRLQYVPQESGTLAYSMTAGETALGLSLTYSGVTYADDLNTQPLGSPLLVGANVRVPFHGTLLEFSAENIANVRYLSSIDRYGPPALMSLGVSLPLGNGNNQVQNLRCTP
jgi:outer membrane receptor protein involved in Fe transport